MNDFTLEQLDTIKNTSKNLSEDPSGVYPSVEYQGNYNLNKAAIGEERNELKFFTQAEQVDFDLTPSSNSIYGLNQVKQTATGHALEFDDTPGNQRILIKHNTGAGLELKQDGSIVISTKNSRLDVCGGSHDVIVEGDATMVYKSNLDLFVKGEFNIDCLDFNVNVRGDKTENTNGSVTETVSGGVISTVTGNVSEFVTENKTSTILGSETSYVKGAYSVNVQGSVNLAAEEDLFASSGKIMNLAANNTTISANDMTVQGGAGTIGGTSMLFSGKGAVFEAGVTAPTFHGDLDGTATTSTVTQSQTYGEASQGTAGSITDTATPTITKPTATKVLSYLTKAAGGVKKIVIDKGNDLKKFIDPRDDYGGLL